MSISSISFSPIAATTPISDTAIQKIAEVVKINFFNEISLEHPEGTLFLIDVDDTLIDFPVMLGSAGFRRFMKSQEIDSSRNWHDVFTLYLCQNYPAVTVEPTTGAVIKAMQEKNYPVCGFTARERHKWYDTDCPHIDEMTVQQLAVAGINFEDAALKRDYPLLTSNGEYYKSTFFANTDLKGDFLIDLLKNGRAPVKVVFADDKDSQVESVVKALNQLGIPGVCYHYTAINEKTKNFDSLIASIQLYYFLESKKTLSDEEAAFIGKADTSKDAVWYLTESIEIGKKMF